MINETFVYSDETSTFPIHNGLYIHNLMNDEFYIVEEGVATFIWSQMDGTKTVGQIITELARLCRCNKEDITDDILVFVQELIDKSLVIKK